MLEFIREEFLDILHRLFNSVFVFAQETLHIRHKRERAKTRDPQKIINLVEAFSRYLNPDQ
jgi:hypothetical protein